MSQFIPEGGTRKDVGFGTTIGVSMLFGQTYWWVGQPFDTVKAKMQTDSMSKPVYKNTLHCVRSVIKNQGAAGLYKGLFTTCLYAVPKNGAKLLGYEFMARWVFQL